ncbi:unnamed protein product [Rhodiola kirilowii]
MGSSIKGGKKQRKAAQFRSSSSQYVTMNITTYYVSYVQRFRKIDSNKWEFANKGFVRGKKHLLKSIQRRKSPQMQQGIGFGGSLEVGRAGFEDELNKLREERKILTREVAELQIEQDGTAQHMELVNQRIQVAERKQKQMVTFLFNLCVFFEMALQQSASLKWLICSHVKECSLILIQTPLATDAILPNSAKSFPSKKALDIFVQKQAEEKSALVVAWRGKEILKAEEICAKFRATRQIPKELIGCFRNLLP